MTTRQWMVVLGVALAVGLAGCTEPVDDAQWVEAPDAAAADEGKANRAELPFRVFSDDIGDHGDDEVRVVLRTRAAYRTCSITRRRPRSTSRPTGSSSTAPGRRPAPRRRSTTSPGRGAARPSTSRPGWSRPRPTAPPRRRRRPCWSRSRARRHARRSSARPTSTRRARARRAPSRPVINFEADPACEVGLDGCDPPPIDPDTGLPHPCDPILVCQARAAPHHARKVALIVYDPVDPASGQRLSTANGWWGAAALKAHSDELAAAIRTATDGHVAFEVVERHVVDEFPVKRDGFRYTWSSYQACRANPETCHRPDDVAYLPMLREDTGADLCQAIASGAIDEVWVWGFDYSGLTNILSVTINAAYIPMKEKTLLTVP